MNIYEFLSGKNALLGKKLLEKIALIKRFEYLSLSSKLKQQAGIANKKYQGLDKSYKYNKGYNFKQLII